MIRIMNICNRNLKGCHLIIKPFTRRKHKKMHWAKLAKKNMPLKKALAHFDDLYGSIYSDSWPSIRLALLSQHKYMALVNNFADFEKTEEKLQSLGAVNIKRLFELAQGWKGHEEDRDSKAVEKNAEEYKEETEEELSEVQQVSKGTEETVKESERYDTKSLHYELSEAKLDLDRIIDPNLHVGINSLHEFVPATKLIGMENYVTESDYYSYYQVDDIAVNIEKEYELNYPEHLKVYSFGRGDVSIFPSPRRDASSLHDYFLINGASILPVIALDIDPGDQVLDMCAAPGGKSLAILQTLHPKQIISNDVSISRTNRMRRIFDCYTDNSCKDCFVLQSGDGLKIEDENVFDKILVDVPCTNDRHSLLERDNNIFGAHRVKERLKLPEFQSSLLTHALKLVKPGGTVVYSTCTLAPMQNDGVVHMALKRAWEDEKLEFTVIDLSPALNCTKTLFRYVRTDVDLRYGSLVTPFLPLNFGPMYFCKIVKNE